MTQPPHLPSLAGEVARKRPALDDAVTRTSSDDVARTASWTHALLDAGLLDLPLPGRRGTPQRYAALAAFGSVVALLAEHHVVRSGAIP